MLDPLASLGSIVKSNKPSNIDSIYYLFFDKGISLNEFNELPIPYIITIIKTHNYQLKEQEREMKKAQRKR